MWITVFQVEILNTDESVKRNKAQCSTFSIFWESQKSNHVITVAWGTSSMEFFECTQKGGAILGLHLYNYVGVMGEKIHVRVFMLF